MPKINQDTLVITHVNFSYPKELPTSSYLAAAYYITQDSEGDYHHQKRKASCTTKLEMYENTGVFQRLDNPVPLPARMNLYFNTTGELVIAPDKMASDKERQSLGIYRQKPELSPE